MKMLEAGGKCNGKCEPIIEIKLILMLKKTRI